MIIAGGKTCAKNLKITEYELYGFYNSYSISISILYLYYGLVSALFWSYDIMVYATYGILVPLYHMDKMKPKLDRNINIMRIWI